MAELQGELLPVLLVLPVADFTGVHDVLGSDCARASPLTILTPERQHGALFCRILVSSPFSF
jgi:hypothetical protein